MYEELIMRLMEDKSWIEQGTTETEHEIADHLQKAADAIEELEKAAPRWIPVKELLPEESEGLRWGEELTLRFTSVWCCDVNTGSIEVRNRLQGKKTGIECLDEYTKDTKWHWSHSWWEPTHWMPIVPLPEKPKEL